MSNPKFRVRRILIPDWHRSVAGVYEVEATPRGASIPAFRLRTRFPVDVMSASRQPGSLLAQTNQIEPRLASSIVQEADRAAGKRGILWAKFAKTEEPGPWCGSEKDHTEPEWPVSSAQERMVLMQCQWMAEWFSRKMGQPALHETYSLLSRGTPGPALEQLLATVRKGGTPVPRRYANTFERLALVCGLPDDVATSIWSFVSPTDGVNFWSELLALPRIRVCWVPEVEDELVEIEFTPIGSSEPEWVETKKFPTGWVPGPSEAREVLNDLLDRDFAKSLTDLIEDEQYAPAHRWLSLFRQDELE